MRVMIVGQGKALAMAELIKKFRETEADLLKRLREMEEPEPMNAEEAELRRALKSPVGVVICQPDFAAAEARVCALLADMELVETGLPFGGEFHADKTLRDFIDSVAGKLVMPCPRKRYIFVDHAKDSDWTAHQTVTKSRQSPENIQAVPKNKGKFEPGDTIKKAPEPVAEEPPIWQVWECYRGIDLKTYEGPEAPAREFMLSRYNWLSNPVWFESPDGRKEYPGEPSWVANFITAAAGKFTAWNETQSEAIGIFPDRKGAVIAVLKHALELNHRDCDSCGRCESCSHPAELADLKKNYQNVLVDRDFSIAKIEELRGLNASFAKSNATLMQENAEFKDTRDAAIVCNNTQSKTIYNLRQELRMANDRLNNQASLIKSMREEQK